MFRRFSSNTVAPAVAFKFSMMLQSNNNNNNNNFRNNRRYNDNRYNDNRNNNRNFNRNYNNNNNNDNNYNNNNNGDNNDRRYNDSNRRNNNLQFRNNHPEVEIQVTAPKKEDGGRIILYYANNNVVIKFADQMRDVEDLGSVRKLEVRSNDRGMLYNPRQGAPLFLSPLHTTRLVGFLEEPSADAEIEITARNAKASFKKTGEHSVCINCTAITAEGNSETWGLTLDAAETLLMSHFLNEAIYANHGFRSH